MRLRITIITTTIAILSLLSSGCGGEDPTVLRSLEPAESPTGTGLAAVSSGGSAEVDDASAVAGPKDTADSVPTSSSGQLDAWLEALRSGSWAEDQGVGVELRIGAAERVVDRHDVRRTNQLSDGRGDPGPGPDTIAEDIRMPEPGSLIDLADALRLVTPLDERVADGRTITGIQGTTTLGAVASIGGFDRAASLVSLGAAVLPVPADVLVELLEPIVEVAVVTVTVEALDGRPWRITVDVDLGRATAGALTGDAMVAAVAGPGQSVTGVEESLARFAETAVHRVSWVSTFAPTGS